MFLTLTNSRPPVAPEARAGRSDLLHPLPGRLAGGGCRFAPVLPRNLSFVTATQAVIYKVAAGGAQESTGQLRARR